MSQKYIVRLTRDERTELTDLVMKGQQFPLAM